ncbi:MAG: phosphatidylserine decarboxylase [Frankiales bacterium]|nr:phosphatidylserine decarboxylase [Frankiales bacterium]
MTWLIFGAALATAGSAALAVKWVLGVTKVTIAAALIATAIVTALAVAGARGPVAGAVVTVVTVAVEAAILAYRFYRDPERTAPDGDVVVSPADGSIVYVRHFDVGATLVATKHGRAQWLDELTTFSFGSGPVVVIGIAMSFLDVHVNRAPVAGSVVETTHRAGDFLSLRHASAEYANERATTVIDTGRSKVAVVQIASRLVRQVVVFLRPGQVVLAGERLGVIRLGSQVDLVLPDGPGLRVLVAKGDRVIAGETVLATLPPGLADDREATAHTAAPPTAREHG